MEQFDSSVEESSRVPMVNPQYMTVDGDSIFTKFQSCNDAQA